MFDLSRESFGDDERELQHTDWQTMQILAWVSAFKEGQEDARKARKGAFWIDGVQRGVDVPDSLPIDEVEEIIKERRDSLLTVLASPLLQLEGIRQEVEDVLTAPNENGEVDVVVTRLVPEVAIVEQLFRNRAGRTAAYQARIFLPNAHLEAYLANNGYQ